MTGKRGAAVAAAMEDVLGDDTRAGIVADKLFELHTNRFAIEAMQLANGQGPDDLVPDAQGSRATYAERFAILDDAEERIIKKYAPLLPKVAIVLERLRASRKIEQPEEA